MAARGGLANEAYPWGSQDAPEARMNYWQAGSFPGRVAPAPPDPADEDLGTDGFHGLAPIDAFGPQVCCCYALLFSYVSRCRTSLGSTIC